MRQLVTCNGHTQFAYPARRLQCIHCGNVLSELDTEGTICDWCDHEYPVRDALWHARGPLSGKNRIAADFYDGPRWQAFRPWEQLFLKVNGGLPGARKQILKHLRLPPAGSLLEVGIGDGENVVLLPTSLRISGVDIAVRPLSDCRDRHRGRGLFLALAEGEHLPFTDNTFDAALCVGGFNFFSDPYRGIAEMARVVKPGGSIVVADEVPNLHDFGWGHMVGLPQFDIWLMKRFWFGPEFTAMVLENRLNVRDVAQSALIQPRIHAIWRGLGYCIVGTPRKVRT
ncbi:MAG: class I SAM-dependent methyltransferase [Gemmataceae bacterium]